MGSFAGAYEVFIGELSLGNLVKVDLIAFNGREVIFRHMRCLRGKLCDSLDDSLVWADKDWERMLVQEQRVDNMLQSQNCFNLLSILVPEDLDLPVIEGQEWPIKLGNVNSSNEWIAWICCNLFAKWWGHIFRLQWRYFIVGIVQVIEIANLHNKLRDISVDLVLFLKWRLRHHMLKLYLFKLASHLNGHLWYFIWVRRYESLLPLFFFALFFKRCLYRWCLLSAFSHKRRLFVTSLSSPSFLLLILVLVSRCFLRLSSLGDDAHMSHKLQICTVPNCPILG